MTTAVANAGASRKIRRMAKKKPGVGADATFKFRCRTADLEAFRFASEQEGFGGSISTWLLFHARNQAKKHEPESRKRSDGG